MIFEKDRIHEVPLRDDLHQVLSQDICLEFGNGTLVMADQFLMTLIQLFGRVPWFYML